MALVSRNFMIMMAVLVALLAASALPTNKDGEGKGGKGKGKRSAEEEGGLSPLEGSFADALAEDAEAAMMLEDQVRERRAVGEESPAGSAYVEEGAADGELQQADEPSQLAPKKPCRGKRPNGGRNGTDTGNGTDSDVEGTGGGEAEEMGRQKQRKGRKSKKAEPEPSSLTSWLLGDSE